MSAEKLTPTGIKPLFAPIQKAVVVSIACCVGQLVVWGSLIYDTDPGTTIKPMAEMVISSLAIMTSAVFGVSVAFKQLVVFHSPLRSLLALVFSGLPIAVLVLIIWTMDSELHYAFR